ncbi:hypothetical protein L208DRAFT_1418034 [Tricholoma matsutake]|nr:hypothetical protein L208DRAFT_1418034 [Tricholoma matsutake 945]
MPSASIACLTGCNLEHPFRTEFLTGTEHLKRFGPSLRDSIYVPLRNRYATAISTSARCENCPCTLLVMHSRVGCLFSFFPQQNRCANLKLHLDDFDGD